MKSVIVALSLFSFACPPQPNPPVVHTDAGDIYDQACSVLSQLKCPEGLRSDCAAAMRNADPVIPMNPTCVAGCASVSCVQACGPAIPCN